MLTQVDLEEIRKVLRQEMGVGLGRFTQEDVDILKILAKYPDKQVGFFDEDLEDLAARIQDLL